jgi:hypothetical protein
MEATIRPWVPRGKIYVRGAARSNCHTLLLSYLATTEGKPIPCQPQRALTSFCGSKIWEYWRFFLIDLRHPNGETIRRRPLACTISTNTVLKAPVDQVQVIPCTMVGKHMAQTFSTVSSPGGNGSTQLVPTVTTTPIGATPVTGKPVSTFCVVNMPEVNPPPTQ